MILIASSESLLSTALRNKLLETGKDMVLMISRNPHHGWVQELRHQREAGTPWQPVAQVFVINEFPFNVYDIYEQKRTILRDLASLQLTQVSMHVAIKLNMNDILMARNIRSHCTYLSHMITDLSRHLPYRLNLSFSCVYNVFGVVNTTIMQVDSNNVQHLLFLLKNPARNLVVPFAENEEIFGTDVVDAAGLLVDRSERLEKEDEAGDRKGPGLVGELVFLPVNTPVHTAVLVETVTRQHPGLYHSIRYTPGSGSQQAKVKAELNPQVLAQTVTDSFVNYLD